MKGLFVFLMLASSVSFANESSQSTAVTSNPINLRALGGSDVNEPKNWDEIAAVLTVSKGTSPVATQGNFTVTAYVEINSNRPVSAVCKLVPIPFLNRAGDPSLKVVEFVISTPANQGINPQNIYSTTSVTRTVTGKILKTSGGQEYKILCRRQLDNRPVTISYASLNITYTQQP